MAAAMADSMATAMTNAVQKLAEAARAQRLPGPAAQAGVQVRGSRYALGASVCALGGLVSAVLLLAAWKVPGLLTVVGGLASGTATSPMASPQGPEAVLLGKLELVDAEREPAVASALHAALGQIYQNKGQTGQALWHLEAARSTATTAPSQARVQRTQTDVAEEGRVTSAINSAAPSKVTPEAGDGCPLERAAALRRVPKTRRADKVPPVDELQAIVANLMNEWKLEKADAAVTAALDAYQATQDGRAQAAAHNLLGKIRRAQGRYPEAGRRHLQALVFALQTEGSAAAKGSEVQMAYSGLSAVQVTAQDASGLLQDAVAAGDTAGVPRNSPARVRGERRLRANLRGERGAFAVETTEVHELPRDLASVALAEGLPELRMKLSTTAWASSERR